MITTSEIVSITGNVFTTMIGSDVSQREESSSLAPDAPITGCVHISGEWNGAVLVQTTSKLANRAACAMLAMEDSEVEMNDRQDTMAELANMIGGNIKSLVPGPSSLSLPTVTCGQDFDIRIFGTEIENSVPLECGGEQLRILICRATAGA